MPKIKEFKVKCGFCSNTFPWPFRVQDSESLQMMIASDLEVECPHCQKMIGCNKSNISYSFEDGNGGGIGDHYSGNKGTPSDPVAEPTFNFLEFGRQQLAKFRKKQGKE